MKKLVLFVSLCVAMCACNDNALMNEPIQESETILSRSGETTSAESYTVTPEMVCKYLNIARKGKTINSLTPVVENGDTLAYVAQYADTLGWDLISGDRRLDPVLANSETGVLNLSDTINPAVGAVKGMIYTVKQTKESFESQKNPIWKSLEPKEKKASSNPQARGIGFGKWVVQDTIYESNSYTSPHIISSKWGQGNPWNFKTPRIDAQSTKVGCVAVALGQIIYHFRKNNNCDVNLPNNIYYNDYYDNSPTGTPIFSNFTTSVWSDIKLNSNEAFYEENGTAKFLSYLGFQLDMVYGIDGSSPQSDKINQVLYNYKLSFNRTSIYDFNQILENLLVAKPIYVSFRHTIPDKSHSFIIDAYKHNTERMYVSYIWDPTIEITDWNDYEEPPVDASNDKDGYAYKEVEITNQEYYSFMMNWGWNGSCDNLSYLAYSSSKWTNDESPIIRYYSPSWTADGVTYSDLEFLIYNFSNAQ